MCKNIDLYKIMWYNIRDNKIKGDNDMSVIILTGKSCSGKDGVRREMERVGKSGYKWWIIPLNKF